VVSQPETETLFLYRGEVLDDLKGAIRELENQPLISPEQLNSLNEMKDRAAQLTRTVGDLNNVFTVGAEDFLNQEQATEAAAAAWDVYRDRVEQAQRRQDDAMRSLDESEESFNDFGDAAGEAASSLDDVADAAKDVGDATKKGAEKGKEGLSDLAAGAAEVKPLLGEILSLLQQIKTAAAEVDL